MKELAHPNVVCVIGRCIDHPGMSLFVFISISFCLFLFSTTFNHFTHYFNTRAFSHTITPSPPLASPQILVLEYMQEGCLKLYLNKMKNNLGIKDLLSFGYEIAVVSVMVFGCSSGLFILLWSYSGIGHFYVDNFT